MSHNGEWDINKLIGRELFCDEKFDCLDGSDETLCDSRNDPNRAAECDPNLCK